MILTMTKKSTFYNYAKNLAGHFLPKQAALQIPIKKNDYRMKSSWLNQLDGTRIYFDTNNNLHFANQCLTVVKFHIDKNILTYLDNYGYEITIKFESDSKLALFDEAENQTYPYIKE